MECALESRRDRVAEDSVQPLRGPGSLFRLLMEQKADGSWKLSDNLAKYCNRDRDDLDSIATQCTEPWAADALATLLVLALIERDGAHEAWETILEKGQAWLDTTTAGTAPPKPHPTWKAWAGQALS